MALLDALDVPPCTALAVISQSRRHLRLEGPLPGARVGNALSGAFGLTFAAMGLRFLRLPLPMPFKALPLVFAAIGTASAARSGAKAAMTYSIDFKPSSVLFSWAYRPLPERTLEIAAKDVEAFEITQYAQNTRDGELSTVVYRLQLVKKDGAAFPFEQFGTQAQAKLRKTAIEAVVSRK